MCAWDACNFILAAGTKAGSDTETTDGIVDGHAYTVLSCVAGVAGTRFDLVKVRNPWGAKTPMLARPVLDLRCVWN